MELRKLSKMAAAGFGILVMAAGMRAEACTRVTYVGDSAVVTGRTLDWRTPIPTNLYVYPRGVEKKSFNTDRSVSWTSKYGSVVSVGFDLGVNEGMNEMGLVCNLLYLPGTVYAREGDPRPYMSTSLWAAYVLDNFATTAEAVEQLKLDQFQIDAPAMPGGAPATLHMAISDASGNSAIVEYVDGNIEIHEGVQYQVLTNAPPYQTQLDICEYWKSVGGMNMLPGTNRSQDRFTRASFYVGVLPKDATHETALAGVFGIIANCAVPTGISLPDQPEISTTQWKSVSDQRERVYYFKMTEKPAILWVDLKEFDLYPGAPIMKLDLANSKKILVGNVIKDMKRSEGFKPMYQLTDDIIRAFT
ncbi:MAG: linear amide C-N hydrolase [Muribaculaceae bacterium]|nr:linear amide C-N hydrolase [Muribaculaceae bacterium]MDE6360434.1 linear amide C-N hydrolase [Muribaculaceae bacterium]